MCRIGDANNRGDFGIPVVSSFEQFAVIRNGKNVMVWHRLSSGNYPFFLIIFGRLSPVLKSRSTVRSAEVF